VPLWLAIASALVVPLVTARMAPAQAFFGRVAPTDSYFGCFGAFYDGDYVDALKGFQAEGRGAIKTAQSNWIDSICYHAMAGECYYQMGQLPQALAHYNSALQLYVAFYDWMIRVQFPAVVNTMSPAQIRPIPWGQRTRTTALGHFPEVMQTLQGQINNNQQIQRGGVVSPAQLFPIRPAEILRCTALAIRRRGELLGPLGEHDTLGKEAVVALARRPTIPNHWSEAWIDVQLGLAYAAVGKIDQAKPILERGLIVGGQFDHPLTALALFELGRIALLQSDYQTASRCFEEATYAAYYYEDPGLLEEAFRLGLTTHLMSGRPDPYPPLIAAAAWARSAGYRQLHVSCVLLAAENLAVLGQTKQAQALLAEARAATANRPMLRGRIGARLNYVLALLMYQSGQTADGDLALANLMGFQRLGSHWLFQIATADGLYLDGGISPRAALLTYQRLLHEPDGFDWGFDPIESLSVLCTEHSQSYENWFLTALERDKQAAFEVADEVRRHRFLSSVPIGGRLIGLRWLLEGPGDLLDKQSVLDKQNLITKYPAYDQLSRKARNEQTGLAQLPLVPDQPEVLKQQQAAVAALADTALEQERLLREMAIRRDPAGLLFPPRRSLANVQQSLGQGQAVLAFLTTSAGVFGFLVKPADYDVWAIDGAEVVQRKAAQLLREMGHTDQNRELGYEQLQSPKWKRLARDLFELLTHGMKSNFPEGIEELVVVPDRWLWYVPFAALQLGPQDHTEPLIDKMRLRFAPTTGLAVGDSRGQRQQMNTLVALGRMFPRHDSAVPDEVFDELAQIVPGAVALRGKPPAPSHAFASVINRLIVLTEIDQKDHDAYDWSPLGVDRGNPGATLADWMALPASGPDQVLLPGFHSSAENSLKGRATEVAGDDLFLNICGLMAAGARTVLISQWRSGGQTSFDLVREFVQELPHTNASDAWQRAVALVRQTKLDPEKEPRLQRDKKHEPPQAEHPLFWAGYLLVDPGLVGEKPDEPDVGVALHAPPDKADHPEPGAPKQPAAQLDGGVNPPAAAPIGGLAGDDGGGLDDPRGTKAKKSKKRSGNRPGRTRHKPVEDKPSDST
jgi:tetratricopeptide (TPR) repeat protein